MPCGFVTTFTVVDCISGALQTCSINFNCKKTPAKLIFVYNEYISYPMVEGNCSTN